MKSGRVVQGTWRSRLHPAVLTAHLQPVAAAADNGEKFYGNKFGVLMLNRLNFLKNQSRISGGRGGEKKKKKTTACYSLEKLCEPPRISCQRGRSP